MATTTSTIVVSSEDRVHFPNKYLAVMARHLFQYGVKNIVEQNDRVFINFTYNSRDSTLKKKFGTLPVRYHRLNIKGQEEFKIIEKCCKRYRFTLGDDDRDLPGAIENKKRKVLVEEMYTSSDNDDDKEKDDGRPLLRRAIEESAATSSSKES